MEITELLIGLGFKHEHRGDSYDRWRHEVSDVYDTEFALIIYDDYDMADILRLASKMLRKVGQQQKIDQISKFID